MSRRPDVDTEISSPLVSECLTSPPPCMDGETRNGAIKLGICLALTAAVAVCGANEAWTTPFQLDRLAFERIHHPTEQQVSRGWMARLSEASVEDSAVDAGAGPDSPWLSRPPITRGFDPWRLASLGPLAGGRADPAKSDAQTQLVRLRPSTRKSIGGMRSFDGDVFVATPGGRPISDAYDFAGVNPEVFAPIIPVQTKSIPVEKKKPMSRETPPPPRPNEVLDLGVRTLGYAVLTTKIFVENLSRILNNSL